MHRVFVYGSLKRGRYNNDLLRESRFIGERNTHDETWIMRSLGGFPGVVKEHHGALSASICGELYEVDDNTLARLDRLEGNGHFYNRELVRLRDESEPAWMYVLINHHSFGRDMQPLYEGDNYIYRW
jgi:gamma-glutamylaminecyclotransferase